MRVVLVTHDSIFGRFLAASLYRRGAVDRVVVERAKASWPFYWRKLKRVGPVNAVFQMWLNRWFRREGARYLPDLPLPPHESVARIREYKFENDDLVIGFGTSIVPAKMLASMHRGFLNIHTGWLPDYRGVKSEFWTLARDDATRAGWTLHYMAARLDAGDIVLRRTVPLTDEDPAALRARLLQDVVIAVAAFVDDVRRDGFDAIPREPQQGGAYYTTPTWRDWRRYRRGRRRAKTQRSAEALGGSESRLYP